MTDTPELDYWKRIASCLQRQRVTLHPDYAVRRAWIKHTVPLGLKKRVVDDLEQGARGNFKKSTLALAERLYGLPEGWITDSLESMRAGGDPLPLPEQPVSHTGPILVPAGQHPPGHQGEPAQILRGIPPLEKDEKLTVWDSGDGRLDYEFVKKEIPGARSPVTLTADYPAEDTLEAVVRRLRHTVLGLHR